MAGRKPKAELALAKATSTPPALAPLGIVPPPPYVIMTIEVEPKIAVMVQQHTFKSTSRGYQLRGERATINGRKYMVQVDLIEIGSKTTTELPK